MKKIVFACALSTILFACRKIDQQLPAPNDQQQQLLTREQINQFIKDQLIQKGSFDWKDASDEMVWSALQNSDKILSVGYKPAHEGSVENKLHSINISDAAWQTAKQQVLEIIRSEEKKQTTSDKENLEVWKENNLPVIDIKIESMETIRLLRKSVLVRYAEPMGYDPIEELGRDNTTSRQASDGILSGSGCGGYDGNSGLIAGVDYSLITPNAKASWHYNYHNIPNAWSKSSGSGVKIMIIDTGISPEQNNLGSQFNQGFSVGRTIEKIVTLPNAINANDVCGHGTTMSGTAAAPRCTDGNACGVAYNSNLVMCRATNDVLIDGSNEVKGVSDAYVWGANNSSVKIISLSLGRLTSSGQIKDAIQYAYGKGKLMFCAGGTSTGLTAWLIGVTFPATLSEVQAVTGVQDRSSLTACNSCHKGSQIDFVIVMEKQSSGLHGVSTAVSGDVPTTVGGSSVATATAAGIAALVWSRYPAYTREQLVNKLTVTSSAYPNKSSSYGWGKLNAVAATN